MVSVGLLKLFLSGFCIQNLLGSDLLAMFTLCCYRSSAKIFPHGEGGPQPFFLCCICIPCTFLTRKELSGGYQRRAHDTNSSGPCIVIMYINHPEPRDSQSVSVMLCEELALRCRSKRVYSTFWPSNLINWKHHLQCFHLRDNWN